MSLEQARQLEEVVDEGEAHVLFEEQEAILNAYETDEPFIGLRRNHTEFDYESELIIVDNGRKKHYLDMDGIVYFTPANEFPD